jgi:UDPglucose 6-dehydrogenase
MSDAIAKPSPAALRWSMVGLGKIGLCMAAVWAAHGSTVLGYDIDPAVGETAARGNPDNDDPDLPALLAKGRGRLSFGNDLGTAVLASDVTFVLVPTPSDADGGYSLEHVTAAFREVGAALREKPGYHLVVLGSTVLPGATRGVLKPLLEAASAKRCGPDFGLCYNPEFVALGQVVKDLLAPNLVLIGEDDAHAGEMLAACFRRLLGKDAPIRRMTIENAELAKLALNNYVTLKISFANMIADLCEQLPGGDVDAVLDALGCDPRVGPKAFKGGLGYGGPCFPRDNAALARLADMLGRPAPLATASDAINRERTGRILARLGPDDVKDRRIAVVGLAYKKGSRIVEASQGFEMLRDLVTAGADVIGYDPLAAAAARAALIETGDPTLVTAAGRCVTDDLAACLRDADAVVLASDDAAIAERVTAALRSRRRRVLLVDVWRMLKPAELPVEATYVAVGRP